MFGSFILRAFQLILTRSSWLPLIKYYFNSLTIYVESNPMDIDFPMVALYHWTKKFHFFHFYSMLHVLLQY